MDVTSKVLYESQFDRGLLTLTKNLLFLVTCQAVSKHINTRKYIRRPEHSQITFRTSLLIRRRVSRLIWESVCLLYEDTRNTVRNKHATFNATLH
jgi:hypothetical protein